MSRKSGVKKKKKGQEVPKRPVEVYFDAFNQQYRHPVNRVIQWIAIPVFAFSILGLVWMVPFPEIALLKKYGYDTFLNWGSFFIAGVVYYYLRLAPTLSYAMFVTIGVYSFLIVQLEYVEQGGGPAVWSVCACLLMASLLALYLGKNMEKVAVPFRSFLKLLLLGPIWLWHFVFQKLRIPY
ncbi:hypothetical protein [Parapedobacter soli]|uniref:hypothetical protein n=1 Tax=Parapedobacter soli TaxID=416955 RepID=UPI0021C5CA75|nr:hypothetical protein [Parapedobacter soli]